MVLTESSSFSLFHQFGDFELKNTKNEIISTNNYKTKNGLLIIFTCNHCPYAIALWNRIINDYKEIQSNNFDVIAINPNINPNYPDDSPENMKKLIKELSIPFEYLIDEQQTIAKKFNATCTPDFFLVSNEMKLLYRGSYDNNWKDETNVSETYILSTIKSYNNNNTLPYNDPKKSIGCSIKWLENN